MDEEFVRLVLCRSSMLFSCITTGFTTKTNQSVYDLCGSNPVSEDIYYFATLGYKHLQNAVNTKQYTYPAPISLLDIEQVISGIELTYSSYVSNQKYSEYHYTDEERKSLLEKISLFELDHKGIVKRQKPCSLKCVLPLLRSSDEVFIARHQFLTASCFYAVCNAALLQILAKSFDD